MNDAEFDRALGAWEDNQLNAHLAKEEEWDFAYDEAQGAVWDMNLRHSSLATTRGAKHSPLTSHTPLNMSPRVPDEF